MPLLAVWRLRQRRRVVDASQHLRLSLLLLLCVAAQPPATLAVQRAEAQPTTRHLLQGAHSDALHGCSPVTR